MSKREKKLDKNNSSVKSETKVERKPLKELLRAWVETLHLGRPQAVMAAVTLFVLVAVKEGLMLIGGLVMLRQRKVAYSDWYGKSATGLFAVGIVLGLFLIAKLISTLLEKAPALTFAAILGLVLASPVALLIQNSECFEVATVGNWAVSILCLAVGFAAAWLLSKLDSDKKA